jgi:hypothetical protein
MFVSKIDPTLVEETTSTYPFRFFLSWEQKRPRFVCCAFVLISERLISLIRRSMAPAVLPLPTDKRSIVPRVGEGFVGFNF